MKTVYSFLILTSFLSQASALTFNTLKDRSNAFKCESSDRLFIAEFINTY